MADQLFARSWVWYVPSDRDRHIADLAASFASAPPQARRQALIKAGGDGGRVWQQWNDEVCSAYERAGIEPIAWIYGHPNDADIDAAVGAYRKRPCRELIVNPEVEWSYANGITDDYVRGWIDRLRRRLRAEFGTAPEIGFSSVASWDWFPYSAWSAECDGTEDVQCYWLPDTADQAAPMRRKSRDGARIVVSLPACQSEDAGGQHVAWTDRRLADLAEYYAQGTRGLVGFNGWQSGATGVNGRARTDFGHGAMGHAFSLLSRFASPWVPLVESGVSLYPYDIDPDPNVWHCWLPDGSLDTWVIEPAYLAFWRNLRANNVDPLALLGLPISGMYLDDSGRKVQWFERARMEMEGDGRVSLGLVGAEALGARNREAQAVRSMGQAVPSLSVIDGLQRAG